jgi:hypothetical protein
VGVTLPDFHSRAADAAGPLLGGLERSEFGKRLEQLAVVLTIDDATAAVPGQRPGFLLAVNLVARLYPRIGLQGPEDLVEESIALARSISSSTVIGPPKPGQDVFTIGWGAGRATSTEIRVSARDWDVHIYSVVEAGPCMAPAAMAAAALGVGELFRGVFASALDEAGRIAPEPWGFNLITLGDPGDGPALLDGTIELGCVHLAGCGAIGQAAVLALAEMDVSGTLVAVDHDPLDLSNLQRYVLAVRKDVGAEKPELIRRALADRALQVECVPTPWGADSRSGPHAKCVLAAVDMLQARIELQAGLPQVIYNAWTQPKDAGVSRHERFGTDACLACLCWPDRPRPSETQLIADALGEHELRVVLYRQHRVSVGFPLRLEWIVPTGRLPLPPEAASWATTSLLDDLVTRLRLDAEEWAGVGSLAVQELYRDKVCGGLLLDRRDPTEHQEVSVPLAHQSALAGILLAVSLLSARVPELREARPERTQARYDVVRGGRQLLARPRLRAENCLCRDPAFTERYGDVWPAESG